MNTNQTISLDHIVLLHTEKYRFMCSDLSRSTLLSHTTKYHCVACHIELSFPQLPFILETIIFITAFPTWKLSLCASRMVSNLAMPYF